MFRWMLIIAILLQTFLKVEATVVAIHGFLATHRSMNSVKGAFYAAGYPDVILLEFDTRENTIEGHAYNINEALKRIACAKPGEPIDFVAHSIGALILRAVVNLPDCPYEAKIGRAVLLAPPNQGSVLARHFKDNTLIQAVFGTKSGWELLNYGPEDVHALGEFPCSMSILVIAGSRGTHMWFNEPNDRLLAVEDTRLDTPHEHRELCLTHSEILTNFYSLKLTREFILCGTVE